MAYVEFDGTLDGETNEPAAAGYLPFDGELDSPSILDRAKGAFDSAIGYVSDTASELSKGFSTGVTGAKQMATAVQTLPEISKIRLVGDLSNVYDKIDAGEEVQALGSDYVTSQARMYQNSPPDVRAKLREKAIETVTSSKEAVTGLVDQWRKYQEETKSTQGRVPNFTDIQDVKGFNDWLAFNVGQGVPYLSASILSGVLGGAIAGPAGATAGVVGTGYAMGVGDIQGDLIDKGVVDRPDLALAGGVPYAAMDMIGPAGQVAKGFGKQAIKQGLGDSVKSVGKQFVRQGAGEFVNEAGQEIIKDVSVAQATGDEVLTAENAKRWFNAGMAGAASGAPAGGVVQAAQEIRARRQGSATATIEQPVATVDDIGNAQSVDEAISAAVAVVDAPVESSAPTAREIDALEAEAGMASTTIESAPDVEFDEFLRQEQIDTAYLRQQAADAAQRQRDFEAAEQARREADIPKMEAQLADQQVERADILTKAQGFDVAEPTAMQLAMEAARAKLEGMRQKTKQEKVQAPNELILGVDRTKPTANNTPAIADSQQAAPAVPDAVTATEQKSVTGNPLMDNPASWVIREKGTGKVVMETFDPKKVEALNTQRYEAVPAYQHLVEVNDPNSLAGRVARGEEIKAEQQIVAPSRESTLPQPMPESEVTVADAPSTAAMAAEIAEKPLQSRAPVKTNTPEFKRFFKDSKVVDENGKPLVMFHGTNKSQDGEAFTQFDTYASNYGLMGMGSYFTADTNVASSYTTKGKGDAPSVYPVYLSIKNPLDMEGKADPGKWIAQFDGIEEFHEGGDTNESWYRAAEDLMADQELPKWEGAEAMQDGLRAMGYDGITHVGGGRVQSDGVRHRVYIAFDPEQIKSAIGNQGTYDPTNPDIRKSESEVDRSESSVLSAAEVARSLTRLRAKWIGFTRINTVQSVADLPADIAERVNPDAQTEGFYDPQTKSVYLIADNIASTSRAVWVAAHEVVGHGGLRMLKDKSVNEALNLAGQNTYIRKLAEAIKRERGDVSEQIAVEEAIAETAAAIETDDFQGIKNRYGIDAPTNIKVQQGLVSRVLDAVRKFLASVMGKAEVSDAEVRGLIRAQMEAVEAATPTQEDKSPALQSRAKSQVQSVWEAPEPSKMDDVIYTMQDKQIDLRRVISSIKESVGGIADKWNPYLQEELFHGRTAKRTMDFQESELRPLMQEMRLRGVEITEFEEYLHNRHAEERNNQIAKVNPAMPDGGSGIDTADARSYLAGLPQTKKRAYEALAKRVDAISKSTRQLLIDSGLEKPETISAWESAYQYYVPLQREESGAGIGQGFSVRGSASKRATGSKREVINVLANLVMQRERAIVRAEKNRVAVSLYGLAIQSPNPEFWLPVNPEKATQKVADELVRLGMNPIDAKNLINEPKQTYIDQRTGLVAERVNPLLRSGKSVMSARVGGEDRYVFFNENDDRAMRMVAAMKNLDADQLGRILSLSSKVTRYFASVNTQYNPIFGAINLLRDSQGAILNLSTTPIAGKQKDVMMHTVSALRGIYIDLRDHRSGKTPSSSWAALYEEFQREGGQTGYRNMFSNSEARTSALEDELNPDAWMDSRFGKLFTVNGNLKVPLSYATKRAAGVFNWLSDYNETMENAVRLAAYKVGKEQGLTNQQSASMAKNLTVNFNRKGQIATQAGALYAFFNASVQGTSRLVETVRGPAGKKIVAGGLLLGSMQALLLAAAGFGDDEPPEFVKSRNIVIPVGDGKYVTIPMPLGFNLIPSISRLTTEFALNGFREPTKKLANFIDLFADTFNPIGNAGFSLQTIAPTAIDPFAALAENRDWTGKPIAKENINSMSPKPGYLRYKDTASEISKTLAYWMNIASGGTKYKPGLVSPTPDQLDYLIGQATGGVGREALKVEQTVTSGFTGEDLPPHKIPLVGRFYGDTKGQSSVAARYYENIKMLNAHEEEIKGLKKDNGDVKGYKERNPEARLIGFANDIESDVSELRRKKRKLLEDDAGKDRIKMNELRITARMKRLNDRVEASQKKKASN